MVSDAVALKAVSPLRRWGRDAASGPPVGRRFLSDRRRLVCFRPPLFSVPLLQGSVVGELVSELAPPGCAGCVAGFGGGIGGVHRLRWFVLPVAGIWWGSFVFLWFFGSESDGLPVALPVVVVVLDPDLFLWLCLFSFSLLFLFLFFRFGCVGGLFMFLFFRFGCVGGFFRCGCFCCCFGGLVLFCVGDLFFPGCYSKGFGVQTLRVGGSCL